MSGNVKSLVRAFIVYVRSLLEYNSVIWSPRLIQDITKIEKVQRRFTKKLRGLKHLSYSDRLIKLGLPSLELRRLHLDLVYCYKMVFGLVKLNFSDYFDFSITPTIGHVYKLYKYRRDSVRAGFFANRVVNVNVCNSFPEFVVFTSLFG